MQDAQDILVVMDKEPAEVAVSLAQDCLTSLIDSYGDKCASVEDYHNVRESPSVDPVNLLLRYAEQLTCCVPPV